ncbi:MAG: hypothetical protein E7022_08115 [Desulfovibrio desulfuricans]|nr:hypothetical protein [Desulfovibrio desulfuricans]
MKVLLTLLKGILWLLLLLALLALLTVLAWWMQWPLITGVVILLTFFGLVAAFLGARALYRWHDKNRFVRKVLDEQSAMEAAAPVSLGRMADAWRQGMDVLRASPHRFQERLEFSQPWFVVLDATGASSGLFAAMGDTLPGKADSPLFWHFLSASVLLRCPEAQLSPDDWQELLTKLAQQRRRIPLRGIVLLLSVADISRRSDEELAVLGRQLRTRAQQLMLTLNRRYPVHVLVEELEALPGMDTILDVVPADNFDAVLGRAGQAPTDARAAAEAAAARLEEILRAESVAGRQPEGDMLEALRSLRALGDRLHLALEQISREVAHQAQPQLAGVSFCQGAGAEGQRPAFLTSLFSYVLPASAHAVPLMRGLPFVANTRACVMGAWLLLLLGACGLMGVNVLYQHQVLTETPPTTAALVHDQEIDGLYQQMLYIKQLEKAHGAWYLPQFGLDALSRALHASQTQFTEKVYAKILGPLLAEYHSRISAGNQPHEQERDMVRELMWLTGVASHRLNNEALLVESSHFPMTTLNTARWNPVTGHLIINAVHWMTEGGQLETLTREMHALLAESLRRQDSRALEDILGEINDRYPAAKICLAQFWPHMNSSDPNNLCIRPAYTSTGYKVFSDILNDLETLDDANKAIRQSTNAFRTDYFRRYAELWLNFIKAFSKIRGSMQEGDVFISYADIRKIEEMPHYRMLQQMADELKPLRDAGKESPPWLSSCMLMDVVVDIAEYEHRQDPTSRVRALLSLVTTAPELMQRLRAETKDAREVRMALGLTESMKAFFDDTLFLLKVMGSPQKSYALAAAWFGGHKRAAPSAAPAQTGGDKDLKADTEDLYANARTQLENILVPFKGNGRNPALALLPGILDFIAQGVTVQAAKVVQTAWENDVLGSATALYRQDDVAKLFGDKGVVQTFVGAYLKPFLARSGKALAPARWGDIEFPFTTDGLKVLSQAEMIAAQPPEDTYYVQLRSQPTLVNVDARERADSTTLTLQCQDKSYTLANRNYPRDERFQYTVKQCGPTTLEVSFPSFTLKRNYATFTEFLRDFQYGERDFTQDDFDDAADKMETAGVNSVTVRILPDNVLTVLQKEGNEPPVLPDRITYVW